MTSEPKPADCYVYITLPGQVTPVTAGRFALISDRHGNPLGQFVYGRSLLLTEELRRVNANPFADAAELFRRMCFNALISNIDDHPRNHAILAKGREFRLSPAYDLTPAAAVSLERRDLALTVGDAGRFANAENILSQSGRFLIGPDQAKALVDTMEQKVQDTWYKVARGAGVSEADCAAIAGAFAYPGFRFPLRP